MSTIINSFVTISCDAMNCTNTATFPQTQEGEQEAMRTNVWLNSVRFVQTPDGRKFSYCSDTCEARAIERGAHNKLEPKRIVAPGAPNAVELAAQAAARAQQATDALRRGEPVQFNEQASGV